MARISTRVFLTARATQHTLQGALAVAPLLHIHSVVSGAHRADSWELPSGNTAMQPADRGTAFEILLLLLSVLERESAPNVVIIPSDARIQWDPILVDSVHFAVADLPRRDRGVIVLGGRAAEHAVGHEYVMPAFDYARDGSAVDVDRLVPAPGADLARRLIARGALRNTGIVVAHGLALLQLFELRAPRAVAELRGVVHRRTECSGGSDAADDLYRRLPVLDFARDVLARHPDHLRVLCIPAPRAMRARSRRTGSASRFVSVG